MHRNATSPPLLFAGALLLGVTALGCQDGAGLAPLATDQRFVTDLAADGEFVYWTTGDGAVRRVSIDGGAVETIIDNLTNPDHVAVDGTHVYWSTAVGEIGRAPKGGGTVEQLAIDEKDIVGMRLDDDHLFWARSSGPVMSMSKAISAAVLLADDASRPSSLAHTGSTLLWSAGNADSGAIRDISVTGGATGDLDQSLSPRPVAANGSLVYWASIDRDEFAMAPGTSVQTISRAAIDASDKRIIARGLQGITALVADQAHVYFTTDEGAVSALPVDGGDVTTFASGNTSGKTSLALDDVAVYWAHQNGSAIFVYPKL